MARRTESKEPVIIPGELRDPSDSLPLTVARPGPPALGALLTSLAGAALDTQEILDRGHEPPLPAMRVRSFRVATQVFVGQDRSSRFSLLATPVNLGFRLAFNSSEQTESRIEIHVETVPCRLAGAAEP